MAWEKSVKTLNRTNNIVPELTAKMAKGKKRNTLTRSKSGLKKRKRKRSPYNLVKEDLRKVPKRSAHNRKQSY